MTTRPEPVKIDHDLPHLVIRASAGSGKTFQLSTRYLRLILQGHDPAKILATTFTRKAAAEVLGRVLSRLASGAKSDADAGKLAAELQMPRLRRHDFEVALRKLATHLHRLSVCTIDGFFNRLCQSFRHELRLPYPLRFTTGESAIGRELKVQAVQAVLEDEDPAVLLDLLHRLHHDSDLRSVTDSILDIIDELHQNFLDAPDAEAWARVPLVSPPEPSQIAEQIQRVRETSKDLGFNGVETAIEKAEAGDWVGFFKLAIPAGLSENMGPVDDLKPSPKPPTYRNKPVPQILCDDLQTLVLSGRCVLLSQIAHRTQASYELLKKFDHHFRRLREERRVLLFSDLTYRLTDRISGLTGEEAEAELADIFYRIDSRVDHVLFDEFQDTSVQQWEVLRPLSQEVASHAAVQPAPGAVHERTFFCVGDTKQAIYGWRGGCAELFDELKGELGLTLEAFSALSHSHRSSQVVLDVVNEVFTNLHDAIAPIRDERSDLLTQYVGEWAGQFKEHTTQKSLAGFVELRTTALAETESADGSATESAQHEHLCQSAEFIARLSREHPGRSIGVLTRRGEPAARLIDMLRRLGIEASGEGGATITHDPAVSAVLSAMMMADHPGGASAKHTSAAAFHVAHSPLAQVLPTMLGLRGDADADSLASRLRERLVEQGYARVVSDIAVALAGAGVCDENNLLHLSQLVELADAFEPDATLRPQAFKDFVTRSEVETTKQAPVRVMTIHRSKGLEFDLVVLPDLDSPIFGVHGASLVLREKATGPIRSVFVGVNKTAASFFTPLESAYAAHERRIMHESACVLYVAMTRARQALHMLIKPVIQANGKDARKSFSLAALLRQKLEATRKKPSEYAAQGEALFTRGDPQWDTPAQAVDTHAPAPGDRENELPIWSGSGHASAARSLPTASPSSLESAGHVSARDLLLPRSDPARLRGSAIHGWFSLIDFLDADPARDREVLTDAALLACVQREAHDADETQAAEWTAQFLQMLGASAVRAALKKPELPASQTFDLWRERAFVVRLGDRILRGVFDRVLVIRDSTGRAVRAELLDYKTDSVNTETLEAVTARYAPQIEAYVSALMTMLGLDRGAIESRLLFVGPGWLIPMDDRRSGRGVRVDKSRPSESKKS